MTAPEVSAARRAARRAAVRAYHPDLGGDPDQLRAALQAADAAHPDLPPDRVLQVRPTSRARRTARTVRRAARGVRGRLPRGVPGWARYHQL